MDGELKKIKKVYGEDFAKLCRELFPTILEKEGLLFGVLQKKFAPNRSLAKDIIDQELKYDFKDFIYNIVNKKHKDIVKPTVKEDPKELLERAGYDLFKCENNIEVKAFKKYYEFTEELCTFNDSERVKKNNIFFAVKKNVDEILRKNFINPQKNDLYSTSVLCLQFDKKDGDLKVISRYNHSVKNPDATLDNDLDNIAKGLTESFRYNYNMGHKVKNIDILDLSNYVIDETGKYYRYNHKTYTAQNRDCYFCEDNIIVLDNLASPLDKSKMEVFDYFILDKQTGEIASGVEDDGFVDEFKNVKKIDIVKDKIQNRRVFTVFKDDGTDFKFVVDKNNRIVEYYNYNAKKISKGFLKKVRNLEVLVAPNVEVVENYCLVNNQDLKILDLRSVEEIGDEFCCDSRDFSFLDLPNVKKIGKSFMWLNKEISYVNMPNLEEVGDWFLADNQKLTKISFDNLKNINSHFFHFNLSAKSVKLPSLESMGKDVFNCNKKESTFVYELSNTILNNQKKKEDILVQNINNAINVNKEQLQK